MIPVIVDPGAVIVAVVGQGPAMTRRVRQLVDGGAKSLAVYSPEPDRDLQEIVGANLIERLPESEDFLGVSLAYFAGMAPEIVKPLVVLARDQRALVNVEDVIDLCDFHVPGVVRRGDLLITVSTGGNSPGLARRLRKALESSYGAEWEGRLDTLGKARRGWLADGVDMPTIAARTNAMIDEQGWLI